MQFAYMIVVDCEHDKVFVNCKYRIMIGVHGSSIANYICSMYLVGSFQSNIGQMKKAILYLNCKPNKNQER